MRVVFVIMCFLAVQTLSSQAALQNNGNLQVHDNAEMGFHIDLINNGNFNQNLGLVGFYNTENALSISGTEIPRFFDVEIDVINHLFIDINTEVVNSVAYVNGDAVTPRDNLSISLDFLENSVYILQTDLTHTDGYASYNGNDLFSFPIGDDNKLRPLITTNKTPNTYVKAAYFNEDPNFPSTFNTSFNTDFKVPIIQRVSNEEFWDFDGPDSSIVTLTWNSESNISNLVSDLQNLRIVGWHIEDNEWKDLGNSNLTGTITEGLINSFIFNPSDYEVLTFGSLVGEDDLIIYNLFSPNNDGINDTLIIEGIEAFENELTIFNRWGNVVFKTTNYNNDWDGVSNSARVFKPGQKLPAGTYFYILELLEPRKSYAGWIYINY